MASNSEDYSVGLDIGTGSVGWAPNPYQFNKVEPLLKNELLSET